MRRITLHRKDLIISITSFHLKCNFRRCPLDGTASLYGITITQVVLHVRGSSHYENTPMQYIAIFHGCKNDKFQMKNVDIFLIFAQNIDRGYTLEPRRF